MNSRKASSEIDSKLLTENNPNDVQKSSELNKKNSFQKKLQSTQPKNLQQSVDLTISANSSKKRQKLSSILRNELKKSFKNHPHKLVYESREFIWYKKGEWIEDLAVHTRTKNGNLLRDRVNQIASNLGCSDLLTSRLIEEICRKYKDDHSNRTILRKELQSYYDIIDGVGTSKILRFNMLNGVLQIKIPSGQKTLNKFSRKNMFTSKLDVSYTGKKSANFDRLGTIIEQIIPDNFQRKIFLTFCAYSLLHKWFSWETCLILFGIGANGKSTLVEAICQIFPKYGSFTMDKLTGRFGKSIMADSYFVQGKIEDEKQRNLSMDIIKEITSGEHGWIEEKYIQAITGIIESKMMITANYLPLISMNKADIRRFTMIICPNQFNKSRQTKIKSWIQKKDVLDDLFLIIITELPYLFKSIDKQGYISEIKARSLFSFYNNPLNYLFEKLVISSSNKGSGVTSAEIVNLIYKYIEKKNLPLEEYSSKVVGVQLKQYLENYDINYSKARKSVKTSNLKIHVFENLTYNLTWIRQYIDSNFKPFFP